MPVPPISAVLIVKDGERHLDAVLASLAWADEVLLLDSGSSDRTLEIARARGARVEHQDFLGYGRQKRRAVELARHDWVLNLDADEVLDAEAIAAIQASARDGGHAGYRLRRRNFVGRREIRHGVWAPDRCLRLFDRRRANFNAVDIHEAVEAQGPVGELAGSILHHSYRDLADIFTRVPAYSRAKAAAYRAQGRRAGACRLCARACWGFLRSYLLKGGWRDGGAGVVVALSVALDGVLGLAQAAEVDP